MGGAFAEVTDRRVLCPCAPGGEGSGVSGAEPLGAFPDVDAGAYRTDTGAGAGGSAGCFSGMGRASGDLNTFRFVGRLCEGRKDVPEGTE